MKILINRLLTPLGLEFNQTSGLLDFAIGILLVILPWFYVQYGNVRTLAAFMVFGSGMILYSIFTDYKNGIVKYLALKIHDALELTIGVTLMALFPINRNSTTAE